MSRELQQDQTRAPATIPAQAPIKDAGPQRQSEGDAWKAVETALGGTRVLGLPQSVALLDAKQKAVVAKRLRELVSVATGEELLAIAELAGAKYVDALDAALDVQVGELTPPQLRAALMRTGTTFGGLMADPAAISDALLAKIKARFGNAPFLEALPGYAKHGNLMYVGSHLGFVRWLVTSTPAGVVAELMSRHGELGLAGTMNRDKATLWAWVDHVRIGAASEALWQMHFGCEHPPAKQILANRLGVTATMAKPEEREAFHKAHAGDPAKVMATGTGTRDEIFDAIANAGGLTTAAEREQLMKELVRLKASADDIVAATFRAGIGSAAALQLLLAAHDVTVAHIATFLAGVDPRVALATPQLVREVRKRAPSLRFDDLVTHTENHQLLVDNEPLRTWFLDSAPPSQLLWFATSNAAVGRTTIRFLAQRFPNWSWVRELTAADNKQQLRALAVQINHKETERYIRGVLLNAESATHSDGKVEEGAEAPDPNIRQGAGGRLVESLENGDVMQRLLDLDEPMRISLGRSDASAKAIVDAVPRAEFPRVAHLLDLTFQQAVRLAPASAAGAVGGKLVAYLRGRPPAEEAATLAQPALIELAAANVSSNLLVVFPSLTTPSTLAKVLAQMPGLLALLMKGSDPNLVMELVSRDPVFKVAKPLLEDSKLFDHLPAFKHLSKRGREAVDRIEKSADVEFAITEQHPDEAAAKEGRKFHRADSKTTLVEAIDQLDKNKGSSVSALALLESHRAEVVPLLADGANGPHVRTLANLIDLPPHIAIPQVGVQQLIEMNNGRMWFFRYADPTVLLHLLPPASRLAVAASLTSGTLGAREWLGRLPKGRELTDAEERALDGLRPLVRSSDVLRDLFHTRFGVPPPVDYDLKQLDALYDAVSRVPSAHLQQGRIERITQEKMTDAEGRWAGGSTIEMKDGMKLDETSATHPEEAWHTRDQLKKLYGFDDGALANQLAAKRLEQRTENGVEQFRMKTQHPNKFTRVVLHEVGHAVDDMLGSKTEPVWGWAKWRAYDSGEFELWAAEMGGWDRVKAADKPKIKQVWNDAMRGEVSVRDLVSADHPALSKEYEQAGVKIVQLARTEKFPAYYARVALGDRVFIANPAYFGGFYSLQADAAKSAPSHYSLYAPGEYFAECYAEYYGEVDGSPGSREKRGGGLPSPVKQWFDTHVDTLKFDPRRFKNEP